MRAEQRSIAIGGSAHQVRRRLGPTAWTVLETLLAHSTGTGSSCETRATVRERALELDVSHYTVARALTRLKHHGIVVAVQDRTTTGRFTTGRYLVTVPTSITFPTTVENLCVDSLESVDHVRHATRLTGSQLAALGVAG